MSEFNWWLLIVGLVVGAGLVWLVLADSTRRESEIEAHELPAEAAWIADSMADQGRPIDRSDAAEILRLHRAYLAAPPPDEEPVADVETDVARPETSIAHAEPAVSVVQPDGTPVEAESVQDGPDSAPDGPERAPDPERTGGAAADELPSASAPHREPAA